MPDIVNVQTTATSAGAPVAVESLGGADYQLVKLVAGQAGTSSPIAATTGVPAAGSTGLVVAVIPGLSVSAQVSGTVSVSGGISLSGAVSGTVSVSNLSTVISGTVSISAMPAVSGTMSVSNLSTVVSGTVSVSNLTTVVSGTVTVSNGASVTIQQGASVTIQAGASVVAQVSGTVAVSALPLTTGTPSPNLNVTGVVVWIAGGQAGAPAGFSPVEITGNVGVNGTVGVDWAAVLAGAMKFDSVTGTTAQGLYNGYVVGTTGVPASAVYAPIWKLAGSAQVSGTVSVSNLTTVVSGAVSISGTAVVTLATGGTVAVLTGGGLPGSTTGSSGMSGLLMWLGASQTVLISTQVSGTVSVSNTVVVTLATGGTIAALLGQVQVSGTVSVSNTVVVTLATGGTVALIDGASVAIALSASFTAAAGAVALWGTTSLPVSATAGQGIMGLLVRQVGPIATINTVLSIATVQNLASVSTVQTIIAVSGVTAVSVVSTVGTVLNVSGVTALSVASTVVTILSTVVVTLPTQTPFFAIVTTTAPAISSTLIFTVYTGATLVGGGQTQYIIPAGKNLHIQGIQMVYAGSIGLAVTAQLNINMGVSASLTTISQETQGKLAILQVLLSGAVTSTATLFGDFGDAPAAQTVGLFWQGTSITVQRIIINGYLF